MQRDSLRNSCDLAVGIPNPSPSSSPLGSRGEAGLLQPQLTFNVPPSEPANSQLTKHYALSCLIQTLLPLHLSFCRTTLKNEASGNEARGSVLFAFRIVTVDSRSTWIGLRPSSVRKTG